MQLNSSWLQLAWEDCTQQVNEANNWWVREVFFKHFWRGQICSFPKWVIPLYFAVYHAFSSVYFYLTFAFCYTLKSLKSWSHCVWNRKVILTIFYQENLGISQRSSLWVDRMDVLAHLHGIPGLHKHYQCTAQVSAKAKVHKASHTPQSFVHLCAVRNHTVSEKFWPKSSTLFGNSVPELHTREI